MDLHIDHGSTTAPYEQIRLGIAGLAASGHLPAGTRLPPVRTLAAQLNLATNTVARAYRELEQAEVIETRGRAGSFIAASGDPTQRQAQTAARDYVARVRALGFDDTDVLDFVAAALRG